MNVVINLRCTAGLTQAELAHVAGKSQPTVVAYESGTESPTLKSLSRIARAAGLEAVVNFPPAMTREDHRGLALHRAIAHHLAADPAGTVARGATRTGPRCGTAALKPTTGSPSGTTSWSPGGVVL